MALSAEDYYRASVERLSQARKLFEQSPNDQATTSHSLTIYISGVAVECILRAFIRRRTPDLTTGHNLVELYDASGLGKIGNSKDPISISTKEQLLVAREEISGAISTMKKLWWNQLRYASERQLKAHLNGQRLLDGLRGDAVRVSVRRAVDAAGTIVNQGVSRWKHILEK